ncbi:MAG: hypothetical protein M3068_11215 [Gemmatimonadota bacterium]|nr:hypothetical protein [Gemmatimonadota bacterium]MDQ6887851.1 hypothetical protein [Gemmatimonadota bacterium]
MRYAIVLAAAITLGALRAAAQPTGVARTQPVGQLTKPSIPTISYGTPQPHTVARAVGLDRAHARPVSAQIGGRNTTATVLHLRGLDGIEKAPGLNDGARRLLEMHIRTLAAGEPNHYLVNTQLAEEWIKAHPVPDEIKPKDKESNTHSGCKKWSMHCAGEVAKHAQDQGSKEWEKLREEATKDWKHAGKELTKQWRMVEDCFADDNLTLADIPVNFSTSPELSVKLETKSKSGSASGTLGGKVSLGFPIESDFTAQLDLFYIPCLPFAIRPREISGNGVMTVGERLTASVNASGKFDKTFDIPPGGQGIKIPVQMIPIVIGGVPVAELDVSVYIDGTVEVGGEGKAEGHFQLDNPHKARFNFHCSGSGCGSKSWTIPDPTTMTEGAEINGQVFVKPAVYTALQLDFDWDALSARVGPQPYLLGVASGCAEGSALQTVGGGSTTEENHVLAADLDWGVELRAEALIAGEIVGKPYVQRVTDEKHLWFRDLAPGGSNALVVRVAAPAQVAAGKSAAFKMKMPSCYPYDNPVKYRVTWTGNATPAANSKCQWQTGQGACTFDPSKESAITLTWPTAGSYALVIVPVSDEHDKRQRVFLPAPKPTQLAVTVTP